MPVVERDLAVVAAAVDARRARVLLSAAQAIRERVVGRDVVHRGRRLRVPVAPRLAAIGRDDAALVGDDEQDVRVVGIDPDLLIVVAAGRAAHGRPREAAVLGAPEHGRAAVDDVLVLRIDGDGRQIAAADAPERTRVLLEATTAAAAASAAPATGGDRRIEHGRPVLAAVGGLVEGDRSGDVGRARTTTARPARVGAVTGDRRVDRPASCSARSRGSPGGRAAGRRSAASTSCRRRST